MSLLVSCEEDSPANLWVESPKCRFISYTNVEKGEKLGDMPRINIHVENNGPGPSAFKVSCFVEFKMSNEIVGRTGVDMGTLNANESIKRTMELYGIATHKAYNRAEVMLYWYDAEDIYHEEGYVK